MALVRELTKIHEEVLRMTIGEAVDYYNGVQPKGEFVLIVEGKEQSDASALTLEEAQSLAKAYLKDGMSASAAARQAAQETGFKKADLYKALLED
jgi:16S rRNA (cytidine1402-2'-O)-methyltransferase